MNKQKINNTYNYFWNTKWFTLVELIIVIAILAILWTIAFISLQWYSTQARDSARISDMSSIVTSLELFNLDAGKYPLPTDWTDITYSWSVVWKQWTFWETADINTKIIDRIVLDPLTNSKYTYSVISNRNQFEIWWILEWDSLVMNSEQWIMNNIVSQTNAWTVEATAFVKWNYNWLVTKSLTWTNCDLLSSPTIIASDIVTSTDVVEIIDNERLVYNWFNNLPSSFRTSKFNISWWFAFRPNKIVVYSDTNSCLSITDPTNYIPRMEILEWIQQAYSGTNLNETWEIKNILSLNINTTNPSNAVLAYGWNFVNNYFWWNVWIGSSSWWNWAIYTVSFDWNWWSGWSSSVIASYWSAMPVLSIPTRSGYTFLWYFNASSWWTKYYNADGTSATNYNVNWTATFYAQWSSNGTFNLSSLSAFAGNTVTISNSCATAPSSYTSSNTSIATVSGNTITAVAAWTTNITPVWWVCWDVTPKTLTVSYQNYPWCSQWDITVWSYTVAACDIWASTPSQTWKYFQWWRNKSFSPWWTQQATQIPWNIWLNSATDTYWFVWHPFLVEAWQDWSYDISDNWWDYGWTWTSIDRQWPCPLWYHVPKQSEWAWIISAWWWWTNNPSWMETTLKLHKWLSIHWNTGNLSGTTVWFYWSSTKSTTNANQAYQMHYDNSNIFNNLTAARYASWLNIRCFKN